MPEPKAGWLVAILAFAVLCSCVSQTKVEEFQDPSVETFPLSNVRLLEGSPFKNAERVNLRYVFSLEPDRLLAPFLREAGLRPKAPGYGNWEDSGLNGHIGGHYVSSLSLAVAATGNPEASRRLAYMLDELERAQLANGDGYLGGVPGSKALWDDIRRGNIDADLFSLNGRWVPWYNLHKTYAGLRDAWVQTGSEQARRMLIGLSDWTLDLVDGLSDEELQAMLRSEHGGLSEVFADVAEMTGDPRYLDLAKRFSHRLILAPLVAQEDRLNGLHANTQIPKVVGYKRVAELTGNEDWANAAVYFWNNVVHGRSVVIGGNSVREHFHPADDFSPMISDREGPETCNTYNMLKLSRVLYDDAAELEYVDYYERALYNHILSSQHPVHGGLVYFTAMRPAHYRVYSQPELAMWCCVGSGIENHFKYGELIYAHRGDDLFVNLFIPSRLFWDERDLVLVQETAFPDAETSLLTLEKASGRFAINIRYPAWAQEGAMQVRVNGEIIDVSAAPGEYVAIERHWRTGDSLAVTLPMTTRLEQLPDGSDYYAVLHGPIVLAAETNVLDGESLNFLADDSRMGHKADGALCPPELTPVMLQKPDTFLATLSRIEGEPLAFRANGSLDVPGQANVRLIPFFRLHDSRYTVYWPAATTDKPAGWTERERKRIALDALTLDAVSPGQQQPESDHLFRGENTRAILSDGRHGRRAEGWFGYSLSDPGRRARALRLTYSAQAAGHAFRILVNGNELADVELAARDGAAFYDVDYPIPWDWVLAAEGGRLNVRFEARSGSIAGPVYDIRLLQDQP